ncbi:MAG: NPCBM/NEW2 domain-containing protein, partial [Bacilli bacterium]|nr:NPCBM/NEW2 domain-containing protein [Bacilli bacterium]
GEILLDGNINTGYNNGLITLNIDGVKTSFIKGVLAHATSTLVYDLSSYDYDYFTSYIGVDESTGNNGNGVKFAIYTSVDGENWDLQTEAKPPVYKGTSNAAFVKIDIRNAKYLKLYCHNNGNKDSDHGVYANAKLIKEDYVETNETVSFIKTVEEYDQMIKKMSIGETLTKDQQLTLLQRTFVNNVGYDVLQMYAGYSDEFKEIVQWLMSDYDNLNLYIMGGKPAGSYLNSLKVLVELYKNYQNDWAVSEVSKYGTVKGELYKRMAFALSLTHSTRVSLWMDPSGRTVQSDAVTRYAQFKKMYDEGQFKVTDSIDITKWFESYTVEEMRFVMNTALDDEEVFWLHDYTQSYIDQYPNKAWNYLTPHPYMAYVWPDYGNPVFHDPERKEYWDEKYQGIFSKYGVSYSTENEKVYKVWMNFRTEFNTGAVCGGISKTGANIRAVHGIAASVIGQPGHAAIIYYTQNADGKGYWGIDNDVSGWTQSEKGERMLLGWGNDKRYVKGYNVPYIIMAQEA